MYIDYTDDSIMAGPDEEELTNIINRIKSVGLDITKEGENIDRRADDSYHLSQPQLIDQIIRDLHLE
jgi:hypothetical protein